MHQAVLLWCSRQSAKWQRRKLAAWGPERRLPRGGERTARLEGGAPLEQVGSGPGTGISAHTVVL